VPGAQGIGLASWRLIRDEKAFQYGEVIGARCWRLKRREAPRHLEERVRCTAHDRRSRAFSAAPCHREPFERRTVAQISGVAQRTVERGHLVRRQRRLDGTEPEMRRPEECDRRTARKIAGDERNDKVQRRGKRLRRERQRVEHLQRDPSRSQYFPRQVDIGKRPADNQRDPAERGHRIAGAHFMTNPARKPCDFLFAIARCLRERAWRHDEDGRRPFRIRSNMRLLDARQQLMNPLVKRTGHHSIGRDQVDAFEARHSREEVPVRRHQAVSVECLIAHGKHHMAPRPRRGFSDERRPQGMFVVASCLLDEMLEMPERRDQKPRLAHEALRSAIVGGARFQRPHGKPLKVVDVLQVVSQRVVEPDDFGQKSGPQPKRRCLAFVDSD